jgi:hypothetical protein
VYLLSDHRCPFSGHLLAQHWLMWRKHDISETRYWTNHHKTSIPQANIQITIISDGIKRHSANATTPILITPQNQTNNNKEANSICTLQHPYTSLLYW